MRTAQHGLIVGYALIVVCVALFYAVARLIPDTNAGGSLIAFLAIVIPCWAVAFATFCGSIVCAGRSLYQTPLTRTVSGYVTLTTSLLSAAALMIFFVRTGGV